MAETGAAKQRFRALDAVRGLCALAVVFFHMGALTHWYWTPFVRNSYVSVDFFFVLSGFVIAGAYRHKLVNAVEGGRFAIRRFGRLYPLHIVVILIYVALELHRLLILRAGDAFTGNRSVESLFEQIFLVQGFTANHESWNYPAWSISVELWLNLGFAALAILFQRWFFLCIAALMLASAYGSYYIYYTDLPFSPDQADAFQDATQALLEFFGGFTAFSLYRTAQRRGWKMPAFAELLLIPLIVWAFGYADSVPVLGLPVIFFISVFIFAFEAGPLSKILIHPALVYLGTISYSVYLTHSLYLYAYEQGTQAVAAWLNLPAFDPAHSGDLLVVGGPWVEDAGSLALAALVIVGSGYTYKYIEEPARLFFNRLSREEGLFKSKLAAEEI